MACILALASISCPSWSLEKQHANRLAESSSPYLRLHADNPVHWYEWGPEAFAEAKRQDKLILVSIGYSSCHWCHVMNRESFSNVEVAKILNEHFVAIKVDREQRPDVDSALMEVIQGLTSRGGWPLTAFLTPQGKPFYGGTYFPPEDRFAPDGTPETPSFRRLLNDVRHTYATKRERIIAHADAIEVAIAKVHAESTAREDLPQRRFIELGGQGILQSWDPRSGGSGVPPTYAPKFPQVSDALLLWEIGSNPMHVEMRSAVRLQVREMVQGGMFDQLGGGFHRYSVDRSWTIPHFEKMLYDQAQLLTLLSRIERVESDLTTRRAIELTLKYLSREMRSPEGLFFSSRDADSEEEEGKYYAWDRDELARLAGNESEWVMPLLGVEDEPNFEGRYVLTMRSIPTIAKERGKTEEALLSAWEPVRERLLAAREQRTRPRVDTKAIACWNGLMLTGLVDAYEATRIPLAGQMTRELAGAILQKFVRSDGRLHHQFFEGQGSGEGFVDDYAAVIEGLVRAHRFEPDGPYLEKAKALARSMVELFWDENRMGFYYSHVGHDSPGPRMRDASDGAIPSANALAARALLELGRATNDNEHNSRCRQTVLAFGGLIEDRPASVPGLLLVLEGYLASSPTDK